MFHSTANNIEVVADGSKYKSDENKNRKYNVNEEVFWWNKKDGTEVKAVVIADQGDGEYEIQLKDGSTKVKLLQTFQYYYIIHAF